MDEPMGSTAQAPATATPSDTQHPGAQLLPNQQPYLRMFVRQPWNHQHQHRGYRGFFRRQGGNHHHTFAPRPLLFQGNSIHNTLVPFQRPRNPPLPLQQSADLTHQPGNIPHPPARLHHGLHFPPNQPANISHQLAHLPYWRAHINPQEAGVPQGFTHHLHQLSYYPHQTMNLRHYDASIPPQQANLHLLGSHTQHQLTVPPDQEASFPFQQANMAQGSNILYDPANLSQHIYQRSHEQPHQSFAERSQQYSHHQAHEHSHLSPHPTLVTYQSDFIPMQGQIPGYQQTALTHSSNPSSMRRVRPQHPGAGASLSQQQGIQGRTEHRNMSMVEQRRGRRAQVVPETYIRCLPYRRFTSESQMSAQTSCVVCITEFEDGQWICSLPCSHEFHSRCIGKWLRHNRTCPMCRADVLRPSPE